MDNFGKLLSQRICKCTQKRRKRRALAKMSLTMSSHDPDSTVQNQSLLVKCKTTKNNEVNVLQPSLGHHPKKGKQMNNK
jgi:hypothetical protein